MTLLLLRHGESEGNSKRVVQGWLDYPLTEVGRAQAAAAAAHLSRIELDALYSSPLRRARDTAEIVAGETGHEVIELDDLREYRFGEAQGLTWDEVRERFQVVGRDWGRGKIPGEEGVRAFRARVAAQIDALLDRHEEETVVAVLHGGVIGAAIAWVCGLEDEQYAQIFTANCGVTVLGRGPDGRPAIHVLNEICHLRALGEVQKEPWLSR